MTFQAKFLLCQRKPLHNKKKLSPLTSSFENKAAAPAAALLAACTLASCLLVPSSCMIPALFFSPREHQVLMESNQSKPPRSDFPTWHLSGSSCQAKVGPSLDQTRNRHDSTRSVATPCLHMLACRARSAAVVKLWRGRGGGLEV